MSTSCGPTWQVARYSPVEDLVQYATVIGAIEDTTNRNNSDCCNILLLLQRNILWNKYRIQVPSVRIVCIECLLMICRQSAFRSAC